MTTRFTGIKLGPPIEVFALQKTFVDDAHDNKVSLIIGAYRTSEGKPWVLPVVRKVEKLLAADELQNHEYLPVLGLDAFSAAATSMLLGPNSPVIAQGRAFGIQSLSGTGALRVAAEFLSRILHYDTFYYSIPSWENHKLVFINGGFKHAREYRYWDEKTRGVNLEGMLDDLRDAPENAIIILHSCAHNPTGCDPTPEQWTKIADVIQEKRLFPLFDSAYQGFASGDLDKDAYAVRMFAERGIEFICTQSFAKNFGLYNERIGNIVFVLADTKELVEVKSQLTLIIRGMYSNPPNHGARIVATVLKNPELYEEWKDHIRTMSNRIKDMRKGLHQRLLKLGTPGTWDHIVQQIGMFSYTGLNEKHVQHLREHYHIYMLRSGRINMCGLNESNLDYVANAINETLKLFPEGQNDSDENLINNQNESFVKTEVKRENDQTSFDSYDEIEEKLKQICDGDREESISSKTKRLNSTSNNGEEIIEKSVTQVPILHRSINYKYSSKDEIGSLLTDDTENIEIIFGSESGEECARVPKCTSDDNNEATEVDKTDRCVANPISVTDNQETNKNFPESIETAFQGETIHVIPNMRAAIKRKRRTREEIMESIKKSIRNPSSRDTNSSDSDISDHIAKREKTEEELNASENIAGPATTKFTVKVSGDREDIFDIMQDLSKDTKEFTIQECKDNYVHEGNNTFVTSIITIDDSPEEIFVKEEHINIKDEYITSKDQVSSNLKYDECSRLLSPHFEAENDLRVNSSAMLDINSVNDQPNYTKYECRKLQQKVKVQEDVIKELTNQLILYKNLEKKLQNKNMALEAKTKKMENMMCEFNTKTDGGTPSTSAAKKNMERKLLDDLTNRVNYLEEVNKKLMKTVTVEGQYKRKLEGQIKQKDNRIKELNWKLEKASKFLDRAEKNTNTYRRKMLNMQTFMRRKKLMDEKMSRFNEMLMDNVKDGYTDKAVAMAMELKEICGSRGYDKLLNFGFPLPSLSSLRTSQRNNSLDSNETGNATLQAGPSECNVNEETHVQVANDEEAESEMRNQVLESICEGIDATNEEDTEETIMGTVQDIFEENNDVDDFSTNELREHFMLQLNAVM
ncbi:Aspartate aminotransferase, cytoplasmic [Camponotus floridanus]|uniref:Aspartate aminotransferase n=1 Tax=Camponotus floridanus TaxID=104421 RepID=E2AD28_CAMFO|nr:Aspartate aminotransferase, cytoplasmic [Camponotus floridanus]